MIRTPTVFITGAGASVEYGFDLGSSLVSAILLHTRDLRTSFCQALIRDGVAPGAISSFGERLRGSDSSSIDTFLEEAPADFVRIGRAAIALCLLLAEENCLKLGRITDHVPKDHWLKYVWNKAREGTSADTLSDNRIGFVTFNYDRLLEAYLDRVIGYTYALAPGDAATLRARAFPIVHLHGQLSEVAFGGVGQVFEDGRLMGVAQGIKIVHDALTADDPAFGRAYEMIGAADLVCCLGFGYHPTNVRRLRVRELLGGRGRFLGSTYRMGLAEVEEAQLLLQYQLEWQPNYGCQQFLRQKVILR